MTHDVVQAAMVRLRNELATRSESIKKGAYLSQLSISDVIGPKFIVTARWPDGEFEKEYTYTGYYKIAPRSGRPALIRTPCRLKQELIREILTRRGV